MGQNFAILKTLLLIGIIAMFAINNSSIFALSNTTFTNTVFSTNKPDGIQPSNSYVNRLNATHTLNIKQLDQSLNQAIDQAYEEAKLPGIVVQITNSNGYRWQTAKGVSNLETKQPLRLNDRFNVGSITKPIVATVLLQLVDEGKLSLDDTLGKRLPKVAKQIANSNRITIRQMLNMTSGIPDYLSGYGNQALPTLDNPSILQKKNTFGDLVGRLAGKKANFEPGQQYEYSNSNYLLLGKIVEEVTGSKLVNQLRRRIFQPLGMKNTFYPPQENIPGGLTHGYTDFNGDGKLEDSQAQKGNFSEVSSAGAIVSTSEDITRFGRALFNGKLLAPQTLQEMVRGQNQADSGPVSGKYGFGIASAEIPGVGTIKGHPGTYYGWASLMAYLPKQDMTIVVLENQGTNGSDESVNSPAADPTNLGIKLAQILTEQGWSLPTNSSQQETLPSKFQSALSSSLLKTGSPGATAAVITADGFIWQGASGTSNISMNAAMLPDNLLDIGSINKTFIAATVLKVVESEKLNLEDSFGKWLPEIAKNIPDGENITLRQLLNGTSGIYTFESDEKFLSDITSDRLNGSKKNWKASDLVAYAYGKPRFSGDATSKQWTYPTTGTVLAGLIVEEATGESLFDVIQEKIIAPLRLNSTKLARDNQDIDKQARGYQDFLKADGTLGQDGIIDDVTEIISPSLAKAATIMVSNAQDVARFSHALFGGKLLTPESRKQLLTFVKEGISFEGTGYGLGVASFEDNSRLSWGKGGDDPGYSSEMRYFPDIQATVVALTNGRSGKEDAAGALKEIVSVLLNKT
jgi:D-alanyl-D-alanine carboxypeptidase